MLAFNTGPSAYEMAAITNPLLLRTPTLGEVSNLIQFQSEQAWESQDLNPPQTPPQSRHLTNVCAISGSLVIALMGNLSAHPHFGTQRQIQGEKAFSGCKTLGFTTS